MIKFALLPLVALTMFGAPASANTPENMTEEFDVTAMEDFAGGTVEAYDNHNNRRFVMRIRCESRGANVQFCRVRNNMDIVRVRLIRQLSFAPCIQGRTWGVRQNTLWVSRGCRADFRVMLERDRRDRNDRDDRWDDDRDRDDRDRDGRDRDDRDRDDRDRDGRGDDYIREN